MGSKLPAWTILILFVVSSLLGHHIAGAANLAKRPNVLILLADDLGFSDIGCYGGEIETPNLDRLATGGLRFTQFYNTARCWPSRAALLTGYYAQQVRRDTLPGIQSGGRGQRPAWAPLIPELLRPLGYRSYHSGKWHVDGEVLSGGFDRSYSLEDHNRLFTPHNHTRNDMPLEPVASGANYYATTAIAEHAIECLREHAAEHVDQPFFSYVAFTVPHFPLHALQRDIDRYRNKYLAGWDKIQTARGKRINELGIVAFAPAAMEPQVGPPYAFAAVLEQLGPGEVNRPVPWNSLTDRQRAFQAQKMAIHAAMVDRMDQEIGRIIAQLEAMEQLQNTLILFASDNGASAEMMVRGDGHDQSAPPGSAATFMCLGPGWSSVANTPFRRHKTWVHEGGISTPLVVHWPAGASAKNELRHDPAHLVDILPTVLELAGGKLPTEWNGIKVPEKPGTSLVPAFANDRALGQRTLWWLHEENRAVRVGNWKLVSEKRRGHWELYDLSKDRCETHDLGAEYPDKVSELNAAWQAGLQEAQRLADE
jgi:arylsulfatase